MANTTFTGPVRSEGGFEVISKNSTTGAITDVVDIASTGIVTAKYLIVPGGALLTCTCTLWSLGWTLRSLRRLVAVLAVRWWPQVRF